MNNKHASALLIAADQMLTGTGPIGVAAVTAGWWPKASACLIRLALEQGVDAYWSKTAPAVTGCSRRASLLLLRNRIDRGVARRITFAWVSLSHATHHHCYDTAPTSAELRRLHAEVVTLVAELNEPARHGAS